MSSCRPGMSQCFLPGCVSVMLRLCGILTVVQHVAMGIQWYRVIVSVVFLLLVKVLVKHQTHIILPLQKVQELNTT